MVFLLGLSSCSIMKNKYSHSTGKMNLQFGDRSIGSGFPFFPSDMIQPFLDQVRINSFDVGHLPPNLIFGVWFSHARDQFSLPWIKFQYESWSCSWLLIRAQNYTKIRLKYSGWPLFSVIWNIFGAVLLFQNFYWQKFISPNAGKHKMSMSWLLRFSIEKLCFKSYEKTLHESFKLAIQGFYEICEPVFGIPNWIQYQVGFRITRTAWMVFKGLSMIWDISFKYDSDLSM